VCVLVTTRKKIASIAIAKKKHTHTHTQKQKPQNPNKKLHIQPPLNPNYWINACVCIYAYSSIVYLSLVDMNNPTYPHIWSPSNTSPYHGNFDTELYIRVIRKVRQID